MRLKGTGVHPSIAILAFEPVTSPTTSALRTSHAAWTGAFSISAGDRVCFTLVYYPSGEPHRPSPDPEAARANTAAFWTEWVGRSTYAGRWETEVNASLILLKALTYSPTGALLLLTVEETPEVAAMLRGQLSPLSPTERR